MTSFANGWQGTGKTYQLGPAVRSADGAGSRPCRRAPGYIPKSGLANQPSSHPVVDTRPVGAPTVLAGLEAKAFHPAPVTVAAYNQYGSYCQSDSSPAQGGEPSAGRWRGTRRDRNAAGARHPVRPAGRRIPSVQDHSPVPLHPAAARRGPPPRDKLGEEFFVKSSRNKYLIFI